MVKPIKMFGVRIASEDQKIIEKIAIEAMISGCVVALDDLSEADNQ